MQNVRTQYVIRNLETHSMELDILAERNNGDMVGIEIQMYTETAPLKRTRYYLCGIDMSVLEKGKDYDELLQYFKNSDPCYKTETFPRIVERVRYFKVHKKGVDIMCEIADRIRNEGKIEGMVRAILELLEEFGQVPQRIVELISAEDNLVVLSRWHKSAAKAGSIAEFEANM